jgi:molybdate transport repressor ModE-like protein
VERETGGVGGGGTSLTPYGENLLNTYMLLKEEQKKFLVDYGLTMVKAIHELVK